ncbi:unnamed protein product, partial [Rotaria sp. Silwood2]
MQAGPE